MIPTALDRQLGPDALLVTIGTAAPVTTRAVGPVTLRHGRSSPTERPAPAAASLTVDPAQLPALPRVGDQVLVDLDGDARAALGFDRAGADVVNLVNDPAFRVLSGPAQQWYAWWGTPPRTGVRSVETDAAGWLHGLTTAGVITFTSDTGPGEGGGIAAYGLPIEAGKPLRIRQQIRVSKPQRLLLWLDLYDAANNYQPGRFASAYVVDDQVVELELVVDEVPAGIVYADVYAMGNYPAQFGGPGSQPFLAGDWLKTTGWVVTQADTDVVPAYFDGSSTGAGAEYAWTGTPDQSPSTATFTAGRRFTGEVTDLRLVPSGKPGALRSVLAVTAVSRRQRLARIAVGDVPWPAEADGARAARILALGGAAGLPAWGGPDSSDPAGWLDQFLGTPTRVTITGDPANGAVKLAWDAGANHANAWRGFDGLVTGQTYTIRAEVQPHGVAVGTNALFRTTAEGPLAQPVEGDRWQSVVSTFVYPGDPGAPGAQGIAIYAASDAVPAGSYCLVRSLTLYESDAPILGDVDPGTVAVLARDVDRQPALGLLDQLAADSGSELVELRDGRMEWHQSNRRDNVDPVVELAADDVLAGVEWAQLFGDVVNDVTVVYGPPVEGADRASVRQTDPTSVAEHGTVAVRLDTQLADQVDAQLMATLLTGRYAHASWRVASLTVDLTRTVDPAQAVALAGVEFGALLAITGFPTLAPTSSARCWVEGWTESFTRAGWRLELAVSDYGLTGPPVTWAELPQPGPSWAEMPGDLSWLATSYWRPADEYAAGRWLDQPTDVRWDELDPAITWATFTP